MTRQAWREVCRSTLKANGIDTEPDAAGIIFLNGQIKLLDLADLTETELTRMIGKAAAILWQEEQAA